MTAAELSAAHPPETKISRCIHRKLAFRGRWHFKGCSGRPGSAAADEKAGYKAVGADINSVSVWDASLTRPLLLVVGGEKRGIKKRLRPELDLIVRLDSGREFGEALSAASAASVLAFEALRQNRG